MSLSGIMSDNCALASCLWSAYCPIYLLTPDLYSKSRPLTPRVSIWMQSRLFDGSTNYSSQAGTSFVLDFGSSSACTPLSSPFPLAGIICYSLFNHYSLVSIGQKKPLHGKQHCSFVCALIALLSRLVSIKSESLDSDLCREFSTSKLNSVCVPLCCRMLPS